MKNFITKFARLSVHKEETKVKPVIIFNSDGPSGIYIKKLIEEIRKYPKLKELKLRGIATKKLSKIEPEDIVVFGDAVAPYNYDYRVVEIEDVLNEASNLPTLDLIDHWKEIVKAIRNYHKANYSRAHKLLRRQPSHCCTTHNQLRKVQQQYYSVLSGKKVVNTYDIGIELPRALLRKYGEIEIEIELPKKKKVYYTDGYVAVNRKNKVAGKKYIVHQNFVKAGLKGYNIYRNNKNEEAVNISGQKYWVVRRSDKKDYLIKA